MHHIIVKVNLFFPIFIASYSNRLRINISMKKHRHSFSKLPTDMPFMVYWHLTWRGNRLYFGPGLLGTLGIVFSTIACMSMSWLWSRGPAPEAEKNAEPCVFHCTYAQNEHVHFFTFFDKPTHWCASPNILWHLIQGTRLTFFCLLGASYSNIVLFKLRDSFALQVKDGPQEVYSLCNPQLDFLFSYL